MKCQIVDNCKEDITKDNELNHSMSHVFDCLKGIVDNQKHVIKREDERNELLREMLKVMQRTAERQLGESGYVVRQ